jgi:hypothetical protein
MKAAREIAIALGDATREGRNWRCRCPLHDGISLTLADGQNGKLLVTCFGGCRSKDVLSELRRRGLLSDGRAINAGIIATYDYCNEHSKLLFQVCRLSPKSFRQRRPDGAGDWVWNTDGVRKIPYRLPELVAAAKGNGHPPRVFIVEGEKDADRLKTQWGLLATTNAGGAGKWRRDYNKYFAGFDVVIIPDNDDVGREHARTVATNLCSVAASVRILELPDLPPKGDVSTWLDRNPDATQSDFETLIEPIQPFQPRDDRGTTWVDPAILSGANWLERDIPEPDFILGQLISTTSRIELIGPTGIGKSILLLAKAMAAADGRDFLHWRGLGIPRRILFVDGEMSRRLAKRRLVDATRRHGGMPPTFFYFNSEDFPNFQPLNTEPGQKFIDQAIETLGIDLVIFDNIQALLTGDMKDEEPWQQTLPWIRDLTRRSIGQIWAHHTGHDETHGYGTKTREWQLDTVMLLERVERPECDIAFRLAFHKARERSLENRSDFEATVITLTDDTWASERGEHVRTIRTARDRMLELLQEAINREGTIPPASEHVPSNILCVTEDLWRACCEKGCISQGSPDAFRMAFKRNAGKLIESGIVGKWDSWCWIVR